MFFSAPAVFDPNCSGEFNEDQSLFTINCATTGDGQAIVNATYSINGNDMGNGKIYLQSAFQMTVLLLSSIPTRYCCIVTD